MSNFEFFLLNYYYKFNFFKNYFFENNEYIYLIKSNIFFKMLKFLMNRKKI